METYICSYDDDSKYTCELISDKEKKDKDESTSLLFKSKYSEEKYSEEDYTFEE